MDNFVHEAQTETYKEQSTIINMKYGIFNLQKTEDVYVSCVLCCALVYTKCLQTR